MSSPRNTPPGVKLKYHATAIEIKACRSLDESFCQHAAELEQKWADTPETERTKINALFYEMRAFYKSAIREAKMDQRRRER